MKYCAKCGNPMEDDMLFCQRCGTKSGAEPTQTQPYGETAVEEERCEPRSVEYTTETVGANNQNNQEPKKPRTVMKILGIVCFVFAGIYALIAIMDVSILGLTVFFGILGGMFCVLSQSPKEKRGILNKEKGLPKPAFVLLCVLVAFVSFGLIMANNQTDYTATDTVTQSGNETATAPEAPPAVTLEQVQKWYEDQMPTVSQSLFEYANGIENLSQLNVNSSRFFFGGDYSDCYYKMTFTCKVNGENHLGEARAFLRYQESEITWFSFEIFDNDSIESLVEIYDDSYDQIIEDYYKELEAQYQ